MTVSKVLFVVLLMANIYKLETSNSFHYERNSFPSSKMTKLPRYYNYNRVSYLPSTIRSGAQPSKTNGFSSRQMKIQSNHPEMFRQPSNTRQIVSSHGKFSNSNGAKSSQFRHNAPKYGSVRYPRRKGNQYGYFSKPQGYGTYGFASTRKPQTQSTQLLSNNQYTSIPYRQNNQGWYTVSSLGSRKPQLNSENSFRGQTSSYQRNVPSRSHASNNKPLNLNTGAVKNNENGWISSTKLISSSQPQHQRHRNPSNGLPTNTFRRPFPQQMNKSKNDNNSNKIAKGNHNIPQNPIIHQITDRPSSVKNTQKFSRSNATVLPSSTKTHRNNTNSSINDTKDKVTTKESSDMNKFSTIIASNQSIIQTKSKEKGSSGISVWAREPNPTPFIPDPETPSLFDIEDESKKNNLNATTDLFDDSKTYYEPRRNQITATTPIPIEKITVTEQELNKSTIRENLDATQIEEYRLFLEWRESNRDRQNSANLNNVSIATKVPENQNNEKSKLHRPDNSSNLDKPIVSTKEVVKDIQNSSYDATPSNTDIPANVPISKEVLDDDADFDDVQLTIISIGIMT